MISLKVTMQHQETLQYATSGASGLDLRSNEKVELFPSIPTVVHTGVCIQLPEGYEAQVRSRSGLAKHGVYVVNSPGTIDQDYRGEIMVIMASLHGFLIEPGMRIAQLVIAPVARVRVEIVPSLDGTDRGANGLGSTGL